MDHKTRNVLLAIAALLVAALLFFGRGDDSGSEARHLVENGAILLDVRTPEEFAARHIPGAVNIPVQELADRMAELEPESRPVVVYCRSGNRSAVAAQMLERAGYATVYDLGSMSSW